MKSSRSPAMTKTPEEKLKEIVTAAVGEGWKYRGLINHDQDRKYHIGGNRVKYIDYLMAILDRRVSINDLIADNDFMEAVYGKKIMCEIKLNGEKYAWCEPEEGSPIIDCGTCADATGKPAYKHHAHKALDLLLDKKDAIGYLYDNLKGGK